MKNIYDYLEKIEDECQFSMERFLIYLFEGSTQTVVQL